jgi:TP901 family phage tail tape measure protein
VADRTIMVRLHADVADFKRSLGEATKATEDVGKKATETASKSNTALGQMLQSASRHEEAWTKVGGSLLAVGVAAGAMAAIAVTKFADFDQAMSRAQAGTMATGAALGELRQSALDMGAATMYTASDAANAINEMGKAGVSTADILAGGLAGALSLAAAGQLDVGRAGEIAATAMNQFGLAGKDLPHVADLLAAGAGKAMGSVEDLANAMKFVGPVSKGLGISIEQTTGVLAEFASQGIVGEQAGTSLRGMMLALTSPSKLAAGTMADLGINLYNATGEFIGMAGVADQLQTKLGPLTAATRNQALGQIFGNEQITAARILYSGGAAAVNDWTAKVNDAGFAARQAAMLTDNWRGDLERLGGSLDTVLIQSGSAANDALRSMTQTLESVVNGFGSLPEGVQTAALALTGIIAVVGILGGTFMIAAPKLLALKANIDLLGQSAPKTATAMKVAGIAAGAAMGILSIAAVGFGIWAAAQANATARTEEFAATLDDLGKRTDETVKTINGVLSKDSRSMLERMFGADSRSLIDDAKKYGIAVEDLQGYILGSADSIARVNAATAEYVGPGFSHDTRMRQSAVNDFTGALGEQAGALTEAEKQAGQKAIADGKAAESNKVLKNVFDATTDGINTQIVSLGDLIGLQKTAAGVNVTAAEAEAAWAQQTMDVTDAIKKLNGYTDESGTKVKALGSAVAEGGATLNLYSEAGQLASTTLTGVANAAWTMLDSAQKAGAGTDDLRTKTEGARTEFINAAMQMGLTEAAANLLADQYGLIPANIQTTAELNKAQAEADLDALAAKVRGLPNGVVSVSTVGAAGVYDYLTQVQAAINTINGTHVRIAMGAGSQGGQTFADGGYVTGPGTGTSDSILAHVSNGEYVVKADSVQKYGPNFFDNLNAQRFATGGLVGSWSASGASPGASAPIFNTTINEVTDPVGTANAVVRRMLARGV